MADAQLPVFVVDDNQELRRTLRELLELEGYRIQEARHGEDALAALALEPGPCIVLLDIEMPHMDGATFLSELARHPRSPSVAVVVMSANPETPRFRSLEGVCGVLMKPFGLEELLPALEQARATLSATPAMASEAAPEDE